MILQKKEWRRKTIDGATEQEPTVKLWPGPIGPTGSSTQPGFPVPSTVRPEVAPVRPGTSAVRLLPGPVGSIGYSSEQGFRDLSTVGLTPTLVGPTLTYSGTMPRGSETIWNRLDATFTRANGGGF